MTYYMINGNGRQIGPFEADELLSHGLTRNTMVWRQGLSGWLPASQVPELQSFLSNVPPSFNQSYGQASGRYYNQQRSSYGNQSGYSHSYGNDSIQKPSNHLVLAIISTILCCLPLGIVSIIYAGKVDGLWSAGQYDEAESASKKARTWAIVSIITGIIIAIMYFITNIALLGLFSEGYY